MFPFDTRGSCPSVTHTKRQGRLERGGAGGAHNVCTELGHRRERESISSIPDVERDLSHRKPEWMRANTTVHEGTPCLQGKLHLPFSSEHHWTTSTWQHSAGFPIGGASGKEPACQGGRRKRHGFDPWVRKIPWRQAWQPTPLFLPGESQGQRSLVGLQSMGLQRVSHDWSDFTAHTKTVIPCRAIKSFINHKQLRINILGDFPGGPVVKNPPANAGDGSSIPGPGRPHVPQGN